MCDCFKLCPLSSSHGHCNHCGDITHPDDPCGAKCPNPECIQERARVASFRAAKKVYDAGKILDFSESAALGWGIQEGLLR